MIGLPVARRCRRRLSSVREADAILYTGGLKDSMKSTEPSSHGEANHGIFTDLQKASISSYSSCSNSSPYLRSPLVGPKGFSLGFASSSALKTTSTVRFWNLTASQPA